MTDHFFRQDEVSSTDSTRFAPDGHLPAPDAALQDQPLAIYVHWPWCLKKCPYCDFNSHENAARPAEAYAAALTQELALWARWLGRRPIGSIFFGGGTPSLMPARLVEAVISAVDKGFRLSCDTEITLEANPTSSPAHVLEEMRLAGINRASVGVQSLQQRDLEFLGRAHDVESAKATLEAALRVFPQTNADLIYGLPDQDLDCWLRDLRALLTMGLPHVSAYQLTIEPNTAFYGAVARKHWTPMDADRQADFALETADLLTSAGYEHYEISNYAMPGKRCRHNDAIWAYQDYIGVGAGAHGRVRLTPAARVATAVRKDPQAYLHRMNTDGQAFSAWTARSAEEAWQEAFMMGLRRREGLDALKLGKLIPNSAWEAVIDTAALRAFLQEGLLRWQGHALQTTEAGWWRLDGLLRHLLPKQA